MEPWFSSVTPPPSGTAEGATAHTSIGIADDPSQPPACPRSTPSPSAPLLMSSSPYSAVAGAAPPPHGPTSIRSGGRYALESDVYADDYAAGDVAVTDALGSGGSPDGGISAHAAALVEDDGEEVDHEFRADLEQFLATCRASASVDVDEPTLDYLSFRRSPPFTAVQADEAQLLSVPHTPVIAASGTRLCQQLAEYLNKLRASESNLTTTRSFLLLCGTYMQLCMARTFGAFEHYDLVFSPGANTSSDVYAQFEQAKEKTKLRVQRSMLRAICDILQRANFQPLSQDEWDIATSVQPPLAVDVAWDKLDEAMLADYLETISSSNAPPFATKCLVLWRGITSSRNEAFFFLRKMDFLVNRLVGAITARLHRVAPAIFGPPEEPQVVQRERPGNPLSTPRTSIYAPRVLKRLSLERYFGDAPLMVQLQQFFARVVLEEPAFEELVLVYRQKQSQEQTSTGAEPGSVVESSNGNKHAISVQRFYNVPMHSIQHVFPSHKLSGWSVADVIYVMMSVFWCITIGIKLNAALAAATYLDEVMMAFLVTLSPLLVRYLVQFVFKFRSRRRFTNAVNDNVANNSLNCNTALLTYIATAAHEQDFKEAILAYFVLWRCGAPGLEKTALDAAAEFVIHRCFKQQLDFEVEDALDRLERDGLVYKTDEGLFRAIPLSRAVPRVEEMLKDACAQMMAQS